MIDTCILVDHLRGYSPAHNWLSQYADSSNQFCYSAITLAELFAGLPLHQEQPMLRLLTTMDCLNIDETIARLAGEYVRKWRSSHGVEIPDALLAATAKESGSVLVTLNRRHFPMDEVELLVPYTA